MYMIIQECDDVNGRKHWAFCADQGCEGYEGRASDGRHEEEVSVCMEGRSVITRVWSSVSGERDAENGNSACMNKCLMWAKLL